MLTTFPEVSPSMVLQRHTIFDDTKVQFGIKAFTVIAP